MSDKSEQAERQDPDQAPAEEVQSLDQVLKKKSVEYGGPAGLEPTRYGDWERKGRCIDF